MSNGVMFVWVLFLWVGVSANGNQSRQRRRSNAYQLDYFPVPEPHWRSRLDGFTLDDTNAVEHSPFDQDFLYITSKEATLAVLSTRDGALLTTIQPEPTSLQMDDEVLDWTLSCNSGIAFGTFQDGSQYLVYTILEDPPAGSDLGMKTRVIAVSIPQHEVIWTSDAFPGENAGSPVVIQTSHNQQAYIALTHNSVLEMSDQLTMITGHFTILDANNGHVIWTEPESSRIRLSKGYGPPGVAPSSLAGEYTGAHNTNSLVLWANNDQDGQGTLGHIFAFQLPVNYEAGENASFNLASMVVKQVQWTSKSSPVFGDDGRSMYMGVTGDELRGWVVNTPFDARADWSSNLKSIESDGVAAIPVTPTLSLDGERLFVSTSSTHAYCINTKTGSKIWDLPGASTFLAARISPDDQRVYFIQSIDGRLFAHEQESGALIWVTSCDAFEEDCSNTVRASFALSQTGEYLFYADVLGRVMSLKLGERKQIEETTENGVDSRSENRSASTTTTQAESGISRGGSVALILLALGIAVSSSVSLLLIRRAHGKARRKVDNADQGSSKDDEGFETNYPKFSGPDPYEDSILSRHISITTSRENVWSDEMSLSTAGSEFVPTDRSPKAFGTIRVAPNLEEDDYSLGAAILV